MADVFPSVKRSEIMSRVRGHGNKSTELALVKFFRAHSITGWRRHAAVFGNPDFVFPKCRVALFVDGCFWHGCPKHGTVPTSNTSFWAAKLSRNKTRDRLVVQTLRQKGWLVLRVWQHELTLKNEHRLLQRLRSVIQVG